MKLQNLGGRLSLCAEYVREGSRLADIGTDHGYLPIALCQSGKIPSALACDVNPLPLESARKNIAEKGLSGRIQTRLSDGLKEIAADEVDDVVIAGMGGELIARILSDCPYLKESGIRLILQPMTRPEKLILWLCENGFAIDRQDAVTESKKRYTALKAHYTGDAFSPEPLFLYTGRLSREKEEDRAYLFDTLKRLKKQAIGDKEAQAAALALEEYLG